MLTSRNLTRQQHSVRALSTLLAGALLFLSGCQAMPATSDTGAARPETPGATVPVAQSHADHGMSTNSEISVSVQATKIEMPAQLQAGPVTMRVFVSNDAPGTPMFARFLDGKGLPDLLPALQKMATEGPGAIFDVVSLYGGGEGPSMKDFTLDLEAGDHVALVLGDGMPLLQPFTVLANDTEAETPAATVEARMLDFSFELPDVVAAGKQVWHFVNEGDQWHETAIFRAVEGMSVEDLIASASAESPNGDEPEMAFVWLPASAGEQGWATIDLPAGDYVVICFLPDLASDMSPHFAHGMVRNLHVE